MLNRLLPVTLAWAFALSPALAAEPSAKLLVKADRESGLYKRGETAVFHCSLVDADGKLLPGKRLTVKVTRDGFGPPLVGEIDTESQRPVEIRQKYDGPDPAILRCEVTCADPKLTAVAGAAFDPEAIKPSMQPPEDFDEYWRKQVNLVHAEPMNAVLTPVKIADDGLEAFDVQVNCPGGAPLSGYLVRPADAKGKSLPAILMPHSAGVRSSQMDAAVRGARMGAIALDFNAHGLPNGKPAEFYTDLLNGRLRGYAALGRQDRETIYFRGMILRLIRALQFVTERPEWDGKTLIVYGSSQGGGQALIAAGLDPRVTLCLASVPALCDHTGFAADRPSGWPRLVPLDADRNPTDPRIVTAARYVDAMNFAPRVRAKTVVTVGLVDSTCAPTSVYAAFNAITAPKQIVVRPDMGHAFPKDLLDRFDDVAKDHIAQRRARETP